MKSPVPKRPKSSIWFVQTALKETLASCNNQTILNHCNSDDKDLSSIVTRFKLMD